MVVLVERWLAFISASSGVATGSVPIRGGQLRKPDSRSLQVGQRNDCLRRQGLTSYGFRFGV